MGPKLWTWAIPSPAFERANDPSAIEQPSRMGRPPDACDPRTDQPTDDGGEAEGTKNVSVAPKRRQQQPAVGCWMLASCCGPTAAGRLRRCVGSRGSGTETLPGFAPARAVRRPRRSEGTRHEAFSRARCRPWWASWGPDVPDLSASRCVSVSTLPPSLGLVIRTQYCVGPPESTRPAPRFSPISTRARPLAGTARRDGLRKVVPLPSTRAETPSFNPTGWDRRGPMALISLRAAPAYQPHQRLL